MILWEGEKGKNGKKSVVSTFFFTLAQGHLVEASRPQNRLQHVGSEMNVLDPYFHHHNIVWMDGKSALLYHKRSDHASYHHIIVSFFRLTLTFDLSL
jgi:hypothetical protein